MARLGGVQTLAVIFLTGRRKMPKVLSDMKLSDSHFGHVIEIPIEKVDIAGTGQS
jgi:hypothetical protein